MDGAGERDDLGDRCPGTADDDLLTVLGITALWRSGFTKSSAFPVLLGLTSSRDVFQRSGPVSPGSDIAAAYRNGERRLMPNGSDALAERR